MCFRTICLVNSSTGPDYATLPYFLFFFLAFFFFSRPGKSLFMVGEESCDISASRSQAARSSSELLPDYALEEGFGPSTFPLTADCSTVELPQNVKYKLYLLSHLVKLTNIFYRSMLLNRAEFFLLLKSPETQIWLQLLMRELFLLH